MRIIPAAILTNAYVAGRVVYLGTQLDEPGMAELLRSASGDAGATTRAGERVVLEPRGVAVIAMLDQRGEA